MINPNVPEYMSIFQRLLTLEGMSITILSYLDIYQTFHI